MNVTVVSMDAVIKLVNMSTGGAFKTGVRFTWVDNEYKKTPAESVNLQLSRSIISMKKEK